MPAGYQVQCQVRDMSVNEPGKSHLWPPVAIFSVFTYSMQKLEKYVNVNVQK